MTPAHLSRLHAIVEGRVQGVGFRFYVVETATALNITGWVRNTYREEVEVTAEGERDDLEKLLTALKHGPRAAYVTDVHHQWLTATGEFKHFQVLPTGW